MVVLWCYETCLSGQKGALKLRSVCVATVCISAAQMYDLQQPGYRLQQGYRLQPGYARAFNAHTQLSQIAKTASKYWSTSIQAPCWIHNQRYPIPSWLPALTHNANVCIRISQCGVSSLNGSLCNRVRGSFICQTAWSCCCRSTMGHAPWRGCTNCTAPPSTACWSARACVSQALTTSSCASGLWTSQISCWR